MLFSSIIFVFLFLPTVLLVYYLLNKKLKNLFLLLASVLFYSWGEGWLILLLLFSSTCDYVSGIIIKYSMDQKARTPERKKELLQMRKIALAVSLTVNLGLLAFYKYAGFGISNYNRIVSWLGAPSLQSSLGMDILLPLGISFYTFQTMSYVIDVYRGNVRATKNYIDYACYVMLFPQLVAGPIVRYKDVATQLRSRTHSMEKFAYGVRRFIVGLAKKMLIANIVAITADSVFSLQVSDLTTGLAWLGIISYAIQIYFDFSAYSDMAIGLGYMLGFRFLENFNYPYISKSVREFWTRWHISLSTWFRDYVYIPLGGNRTGEGRTYMNLIIVFFLCGLWHGANWTFVVWGLFHGFFLVIERLFLGRLLQRLWSPLQHAYTLLVVLIGWVLFRSHTLTYAAGYITALFGWHPPAPTDFPIPTNYPFLTIFVIGVGIIGSMPFIKAVNKWFFQFDTAAPDDDGEDGVKRGQDGRVNKMTNKTANATADLSHTVGTSYIIKKAIVIIALALLLLGSIMALAAGTYNPFIYFRF